jgi:hypothetical protein
MTPERKPAADPALLDWGYRLVWLLCIGVYLTVFLSGVQAGGSELVTMARAMGFTLAAAVLGRLAMSVIGRATQPVEQPPLATEDGTVGSLVDLVSSPTLAQHTDSQ